MNKENNQEVVIVEESGSKLVVVDAKKFGIEESRAVSIRAAFVPMLNNMVDLEVEYNLLKKEESENGITKDLTEKADELKKKYVKVRTGTAAIHKKQKAFYLSAGRFIDSWKNTQLAATQGIEEDLDGIKNHFENIKKEEIKKLQESRAAEFAKYGGEVIPGNLGEMLEEVWTNFIAGTKLNFETRKAAEEKAEADRLEKERKEELEKTRRFQCSKLINFIPNFETTLFAELSDNEYKKLVDNAVIKRTEYEEEQKRIQAENERLKKEQDEAETKRIKSEKENQKKLDDQKKKDDEEKAKIKAAADKKLKKEQDEIKRLKKIESERLEAEEADRKAKIELEKKAAAAPDNEKLKNIRLDLLEYINTVDLISLEGSDARSIQNSLVSKLYDSVNVLTDYLDGEI